MRTGLARGRVAWLMSRIAWLWGMWMVLRVERLAMAWAMAWVMSAASSGGM